MLFGVEEIVRFLAIHPPFDALPAEVLEQTASRVEVGHFPRGTHYPEVVVMPRWWRLPLVGGVFGLAWSA